MVLVLWSTPTHTQPTVGVLFKRLNIQITHAYLTLDGGALYRFQKKLDPKFMVTMRYLTYVTLLCAPSTSHIVLNVGWILKSFHAISIWNSSYHCPFQFTKWNWNARSYKLQEVKLMETSLSLIKWSWSRRPLQPCFVNRDTKQWTGLEPTPWVQLELERDKKNHMVDPSLRRLPFKGSLACHVLESILKVGWDLWNLLFSFSKFGIILISKIGYVHGTHCPESWISLCKVKLVHPS